MPSSVASHGSYSSRPVSSYNQPIPQRCLPSMPSLSLVFLTVPTRGSQASVISVYVGSLLTPNAISLYVSYREPDHSDAANVVESMTKP